MKQNTLITEQFGSTANAYLSSTVHSEGADLQRLARLSSEIRCESALDLGCGAGHAAFAMAKSAAKVVAYDLSANMLAVVQKEAAQRGLGNLFTQLGSAEQLPFADASFDLVATRFSAHHWSDVPAALREARRVLKPTGSLVVIDVVAAENPLFDTVLQTVEILRDASHIRDYRRTEWQAMLSDAGFAAPESDSWNLTMEFPVWIARMRTPPLRADAVRDVLSNASDEARKYFKVQADSSFDIEVAWIKTTPRI